MLNKPNVLHQLRAAWFDFHNELALVEGLELGAMPDADQGRLWQALHQQAHQMMLARRIEGGR